jgi:hypothetical protein
VLAAAEANWVMIVVFQADHGPRIIERTKIHEDGCRVAEPALQGINAEAGELHAASRV